MGTFLADGRAIAKLKRTCPLHARQAAVDDRRVISGIILVIKGDGRWVDAPAGYGPRKTLHSRFQRWAAKGVWCDILHALAGADEPPVQLLIESSMACFIPFYNSMMPQFTAVIAATVLLEASIFRITFFIWKLTVFNEIPKIFPISHDDFPLAVHKMHSFSLGERSGTPSTPFELENFATLT